MLVAAVGDNAYDFVKTLHILAAIIGFGAVTLNGLYAAKAAKAPAAEGAAIAEANFQVSKIGEYFIYAVFILGFATQGLSDGFFELSQTWLWLSILLYVIGIGISHGLLWPTEKKANAIRGQLAAAPARKGAAPPEVGELEQLGKRAAAAGMALNLILVVIVFLMVYKPGV